jgi:hypothetical protein
MINSIYISIKYVEKEQRMCDLCSEFLYHFREIHDLLN